MEKNTNKISHEEKMKMLSKAQYASRMVIDIIKKGCMTEDKKVKGDVLLYLLSSLAGVACVRSAANKDKELLIKNMNIIGGYTSMIKLGTDIGDFYYGDAINEYIFNNEFSVWKLIVRMYCSDNPNKPLPNVESIIKNVSSNIGKKEYRIWDNSRNPYEEKDEAKKTFLSLEKYLAPLELSIEQLPIVFGMAVALTIKDVEQIFPKNLNCLEMVLETIVFNAHMDYI